VTSSVLGSSRADLMLQIASAGDGKAGQIDRKDPRHPETTHERREAC
jgi:hypothetical protein